MRKLIFTLVILLSVFIGRAQTNYYWNGASIAASPAAGGTGTWTTANAWRQPTNVGAQATWASGNNVIFPQSSGTVTLGSATSAALLDFQNTSGAYTLTGAGPLTISGTNPSIKISGTSTTQVINIPIAGTTITVLDNGGVSGGTALTFGATNTFTGNLIIGTGGSSVSKVNRVNVTSATAIPSTATIRFESWASFVNTGVASLTLPNNLVLNNAGSGTNETFIGGTSGNNVNFTGNISGSANVTFSAGTSGGAAIVTLTPATANTYTGTTTINCSTTGVVKLGSTNAIPKNQLIFGTAANTVGAVDLNARNLSLTGLSVGTSGTVNGITNTVAATTSTLTIDGAVTSIYSSVIGIPSNISNLTGASNNIALTLASTNTGALTLTGTNTYTGATTVNGGTLFVNTAATGLAAGSAVSVGVSGTLGGNGKAAGTLSLSGTVSPGATASPTIGNFTTGAQTWNNGANLKFDISNVAGTPGTNWDLLTSTGAIDVSTGSYTIDLTGNPTGFSNLTGYHWVFATGTSITGFNASNFTVHTTNFSPAFTGAFSVSQNGSSLQVDYIPPVASITAAPNSFTGLNAVSGTPSTPSVQFNLTGTNLDGSTISIAAPTNFEVSLDNSTFSGTVTLTNGTPASYSAPTLNSITIYARITSSASLGAVSGNISTTGGGISAPVTVSISGFVLATPPSTQATNVTFANVTPNTFDVSWTPGIGGSNHLVVVRPAAATNVVPVNGNGYSANLNVTLAGTTGTNNFVVYGGTATGPITVAGLTGSTNYSVEVYEFNGSTTTANYLTTTATQNPNTQLTATPIYYWNGATPTAGSGVIANGGTGTWTTANAWVEPANPGTGATWVDGNPAIVAGTAGTISIANGTTVSPSSTTFKTTNYVITSAGTTTSILAGSVSLDPSINLTVNDPTQTGNRTLSVNSVTGGPGSSLTIGGAQSGSNNSRVNIAQANGVISVPVIIAGTGAATAFAGIVGTATGTSVTGNITNNGTEPTMIGSTSGFSLTVSGDITGTAGVAFAAGSTGGAGTVTLSGTNTYSGRTDFLNTTSGVIKCGSAGALSPNSVLNLGAASTFGSPLDLNGFDETIAGLTSGAGGTGSITNKAAGAGTNTLTINQSTNKTFGLTITDGTTRKIAVVKSGAGNLTLTASNAFTGGLTLTDGKIILGIGNIIPDVEAMTFNGGTFSTGATTGFSETVGTLNLTENSIIALGTGGHLLNFSNSSSISWTAGKTLTINGWAGIAGNSGTSGQVFLGTDATGLTAGQLAQITFTGFNPGALILNTGEVVPASANLVVDQSGFNGNFGNINVGSSSAEQSFVVSGTSLDPTVIITPPAGYQISLTSGTGYQTTAITLNTSGGILTNTTIYVEFIPVVAGPANSNINVVSGAVTQTVAVTGNGIIAAFYSITSGHAATDVMWSYSPTGTAQTIASLGGFSPGIDVIIQNGTTVTTSTSQEIKSKNLTVNTGGILKGLNPGTGFNPYYINVFGDITVDGQLGAANGADSIGLNIEGTGCTISGAGSIDLQRIRKSANTNVTTNLIIASNINLWWGATALYNNFSGTATFNVTVNSGAVLNLEGKGDLTIDGTDGTGSGQRTGIITANGTITGVDTIYASTNNTSAGSIGISIGNGGLISANRVMTAIGGAGTFAFNVQAGGKLDIYTALELHSGIFAPVGTVTFKSTSVNSVAYLDNFTAGFTGTYSGQISAERFYASSSTYNQHFMGSPVNTPAFSQFGAAGTAGYIVPTGNCDESHIAQGSPYGTVFAYDETHGATCASAQWLVKIAGNAQNGVGYSVAKTGSGVLTLTGTPNLAPNIQVAGLTNSGWATTQTLQLRFVDPGWHLVANPYLAILNISTASPGFDNQVQVWDAQTGHYIAGVVGSVSIAPFQAFMVHKTSPGGTATYILNPNNTDRSRTPQTFYQANGNELTIHAVNTSNNFMDETKVAFNTAATDQFDPQYDANKLAGELNRHTLYSLNNGKWMAINTLHDIAQTSTVEVGFEPGATATYKFSFIGINTFDPTSYIYLEDKALNIMHDAKSGDYSFTADSADAWDRFVLHFTPAVSVNTTDATCSVAGAINVTQPGTANWNYALTDNNNVTVSSGTLNQNNPLNMNATAGIYTLTLTDNSNYSVVKSIQVNGAQPIAATFSASSNTVQESQDITFTSSVTNASSYQWNFGNGMMASGQSVTFSYPNSGVYNVVLTVSNLSGCSASTAQTVTVTSITTGITAISDNGINIWSSENKVYVNFGATKATDVSVAIFNILGQQISNEKFTSAGIYQREVDNIEAGFVMVSVKVDDRFITKKLFIANSQK